MASDLGSVIQNVGGAVGALFSSKGDAAEARDFQGAATLAEQNAQLAATSTRIQETQVARQVSQALGTTQADVAGAGFTMSGSALDILRMNAQQGSLAKSLVNIQGAINENSFAAQAGAYKGEATAANEASTAGTVGAIASIGGALISGTGKLASAGNTVAKGYDYVTGLLTGSGATAPSVTSPELASFLSGDYGAAGSGVDWGLSSTDTSLNFGASLGSTDIGLDTSGISLGTTEEAATTGISDAVLSGFSDIGAGIGDAVSAAASAASDIGGFVASAASGAGEFLSVVGDAAMAALAC